MGTRGRAIRAPLRRSINLSLEERDFFLATQANRKHLHGFFGPYIDRGVRSAPPCALLRARTRVGAAATAGRHHEREFAITGAPRERAPTHMDGTRLGWEGT